LTFDIIQEDQDILQVSGDETITLTSLNPIQLAVYSKSLASLKELANTFGLRDSLRN
jgi:hypothetical protein